MTVIEFKIGDQVRHVKSARIGIIKEAIDGGNFNIEVAPSALGQDAVQVWNEKDIEPLNVAECVLVDALVKAKLLKTALNKLVEEAKTEYGKAEEAMQAYFERTASQATKLYDGVGRVSIDGVEYFTDITEESKEIAFKEIEAMGRGEIIKRTIHPKTLTSFVTELAENGEAIPEHISYFHKPKLSFAKEIKKKTGKGF